MSLGFPLLRKQLFPLSKGIASGRRPAVTKWCISHKEQRCGLNQAVQLATAIWGFSQFR